MQDILYYQDISDQTRENEVGGICSTNWRGSVGNPEGKRQLSWSKRRWV